MEALRRGNFCKKPIKTGELLPGTVLCGGSQEPLTVGLFARPQFRIAASSSQNLHSDQTAEMFTGDLQGPVCQVSMMGQVEHFLRVAVDHLSHKLTSVPGCLRVLLGYFIGVAHVITDNKVTLYNHHCFHIRLRSELEISKKYPFLFFFLSFRLTFQCFHADKVRLCGAPLCRRMGIVKLYTHRPVM